MVQAPLFKDLLGEGDMYTLELLWFGVTVWWLGGVTAAVVF